MHVAVVHAVQVVYVSVLEVLEVSNDSSPVERLAHAEVPVPQDRVPHAEERVEVLLTNR